MPAFSQSLEAALHRAIEHANDRHHEYATPQSTSCCRWLDDRDASAVMRACSVDLDGLRARITEYLDNELVGLFVKGSTDAQPTRFRRVIHRAVVHVQSLRTRGGDRRQRAGGRFLPSARATRRFCLQEQEMTRFDAVQYISHGIIKRPGMSDPKHVRGVDEEQEASGKGDDKKQAQDALNTYCVNLNKKARGGRIDPLIGRESGCCALIRVLCRRQKNNPLFVGDPGVGKTKPSPRVWRVEIVSGDVPGS